VAGARRRADRKVNQPRRKDFLVDFGSRPTPGYADAYFGLREALEELFKRPADLVVASAIRNPYFLESVRLSKTLLYAA